MCKFANVQMAYCKIAFFIDVKYWKKLFIKNPCYLIDKLAHCQIGTLAN